MKRTSFLSSATDINGPESSRRSGIFPGGYNGIPVSDYVDTNMSSKVAKIILSYVGIVNRMTW